MLSKRLNIMLYSESTGEQIILPINPSNIEIKYEKDIQKFNILGYGEVNVMGHYTPLRITLSHFLPEDDSIFGTTSGIIYNKDGAANSVEHAYSSEMAANILKRWATEKITIRLVIEDEINLECVVILFSQTLRESTAIKPYTLTLLEYRNPAVKTKGVFGLIKRAAAIIVPKIILAKASDTLYSIANKYKLNFKKLAKNNNIDDVNKKIKGTKLFTGGAK